MSRLLRTKNIEKVAQALSDDPVWREGFLTMLESGDRGLTAVAWMAAGNPGGLYEPDLRRPAWLPDWIDVAAKESRLGSLPEHDMGAFYLLDLSSTFALAPLGDIDIQGGLLLDVCAAPGGKGIVARRYCKPDVQIGNEVIRKRTAQLIANYKRCRIDPALVTSVDPKLLARLLESRARLVIVDAPCSGQSLVLKGLAAPGAFHPATIAMNERRQRRILAESSKTVEPGGYLLYATCTFSPEENERNVEWFSKNFPEFSAREVPCLQRYRSQLSDQPSYRLFPQACLGAGAFCCLFQRAGGACDVSMFSAQELPSIIRPVWRSEFFAADTYFPSHPEKREGRAPGKETRGKYSRRWTGRSR
jgi:16S rRNA C967 or C1407 C5-methylase (RsmB/RsmF family)